MSRSKRLMKAATGMAWLLSTTNDCHAFVVVRQRTASSSIRATADFLNQIAEVNTVYDSRSALVYDPTQERFVVSSQTMGDRHSSHRWKQLLNVAFVPSGVTSNYYQFMQWRVLQRFVNANLHVFGTQSLVLALGLQSSATQLGALSAALNWVLKDCLGKVSRMVWASKMGLRFDSDAKRWRMRSAYIYGLGNLLEITTYMFPHLFLIWATLANCCKQISMLTSSSTKSSIFNSFRDGSRENIGDITAKGEAQTAIVDLLGIATGVYLSKSVVGTSIKSILCVYAILQVSEIYCVYQQLRAVQFRVLNFERLIKVISDFVKQTSSFDGKCINGGGVNGDIILPTPEQMAQKERMFLPPKHLSRRTLAFGSLGRSKLSLEELERLTELFGDEKFLLAIGKNVKHPKRIRLVRNKQHELQENCHVVLHTQATNADIVKATLALIVLRQQIAQSEIDPDVIRSSDCYDMIEYALKQSEKHFAPLLRQIAKHGWDTPARFMFGRVRMRADWPLR